MRTPGDVLARADGVQRDAGAGDERAARLDERCAAAARPWRSQRRLNGGTIVSA